MDDSKSRYYGLKAYTVPDRKGREVSVLPVAPARKETRLGIHRRRQGQRLDHLAAKYLDDAAGFWRIAELADVMYPEALSEEPEIAIPTKRRL